MVTPLAHPRSEADALDSGYWFMLGELRAELARRRMTQTELAAATGLAQPHVSARLSGRIPFRYPELMRVAVALGLSMADLARWSEGPGVGSYRVTGDYRLGARAVA